MEDLQNLNYKELQKLAKAAGIRAKGPKVELLNVLIALNNASLNWNPHSIYIRSMNLQTHSPDTFAGGIIPSTTQNQKKLLNTL